MSGILPKITLGMGCFWAGDALYGATRGVITTCVGYSGGSTPNPTYKNIGDHTEVIQIHYNPQHVTFEDLLQLFWNNHEYGLSAKIKRQYASRIFYHNEEQKENAEYSKKNEITKRQGSNIFTEILPAGTFYPAEDYHQKYRLQRYPMILKQLNLTPSDLQTSELAARVNGYVAGVGKREDLDEDMKRFNVPSQVLEFVLLRWGENQSNGLYC